MPTEVELKLSATPAAWAAVRRHRALTEANAGRARSTLIVSRYYDTPTHELHQRGIALRLRRRGARWLQTVKGAGDAAAGMHRRTEYEWPLSRASLDPAKLAETPWAELFAKASGRLAAVFTTEVKRTERALKFDDGTRATLSFDQGAVRAGRKRLPLCEIEIELVEGDARRLYDLALALCADIPLTLAHASKADQGYALATSRPPRPIRAGKVALAPDVAAPQALAAIATDCLGQIGGNAEAMRAGRDGEFLHQLRVGMRRLRSLLKLARRRARRGRDRVDRSWSGRAGPGVRSGARLGRVCRRHTGRDRAASGRQGAARLSAPAPARLAQAAVPSRGNAGRSRIAALHLSAARAGQAPHRARACRPRSAGSRARPRRARTRANGGCANAASGFGEADAAARHRVRVAAKKLRYAAEFFAPLFRHAGAKAYVDALSKLQGTLGHLNDMAAAAR